MTRPRNDQDRPQADAPWRRPLFALGVVMAAAGTATLLLGAFPGLHLHSRAGALVASLIPYGTVAWFLAAVFLLAAGGKWSRLVALALPALVVQVYWTQPYWRHAPVEGLAAGAPWVSVMVVNLRCDFTATADLSADIEREDPDAVILVDVIPTVWRELRSSVLADMDIYRQTTRRSSQPEVSEVPGEPCFTGVAARGPVWLVATTDSTNPQHVLRVDLPTYALMLIAVDVENPLEGFTDWKSDLAAVRDAVTMVGQESPLVVVGDFNAVREHAPMVALRGEGLVDAAEQAGAGWLRTYPSDWALPPILAIDHVLVRGGWEATSVVTFRVEGTDHLGLVARIGGGPHSTHVHAAGSAISLIM